MYELMQLARRFAFRSWRATRSRLHEIQAVGLHKALYHSNWPATRLSLYNARCKNSQHLVHVSFGTDNFSQALARLRRSATKVGINDIRIYRPHHPVVRRATKENPRIMRHSRGAGFWLWKPYILLDTLNAVEEGTIIIYSDAGQRYIGNPSCIIELAKMQEVVLFHTGRFQRHWTKRDCFVLLQADAPMYWDARQLDASIQVYRAGPTARKFLEELLAAMRIPRALSDAPNIFGLPNFDGFCAHRRDQSILTILAIKHRIRTFPVPKIVVKEGENVSPGKVGSGTNLPSVFEHHRCRNEPLTTYYWRMLKELLELA